MPVIIEFNQVTVITPPNKTILSGITFTLQTGAKVALCGKSGSGKSTVLKTLLGLHPLASGSVHFQGCPLNASTLATIRSQAAYIGQEPVLAADTVRSALLLPFQFKAQRSHAPSEAQINAVLERLHLPQTILEQECSRISGGEKQRIALARGLLLGKNLYLLDEVTSALDPESKQAVLKVFADPNLTVLSVTHDADWLAQCSRMLELAAGRIIMDTNKQTNHDHT